MLSYLTQYAKQPELQSSGAGGISESELTMCVHLSRTRTRVGLTPLCAARVHGTAGLLASVPVYKDHTWARAYQDWPRDERHFGANNAAEAVATDVDFATSSPRRNVCCAARNRSLTPAGQPAGDSCGADEMLAFVARAESDASDACSDALNGALSERSCAAMLRAVLRG